MLILDNFVSECYDNLSDFINLVDEYEYESFSNEDLNINQTNLCDINPILNKPLLEYIKKNLNDIIQGTIKFTDEITKISLKEDTYEYFHDSNDEERSVEESSDEESTEDEGEEYSDEEERSEEDTENT